MSRMVTDMMGRLVDVPDLPERIVSLVPSQTELLFHLGLGTRVCGVTRFCIHPESARRSARVVGGTKAVRKDRVLDLQPDLVIGNREENDEDSILAITGSVPVWLSDVRGLEDALSLIALIGDLTGTSGQALSLQDRIRKAFETWSPPTTRRPMSVLYLIWAKPWMGAGCDTFIDRMLNLAGFRNVLGEVARYPVLDPDSIARLRPDLVLLSSEPFPFRNDHAAMLSLILPDALVLQVDGEPFSWYGSRLAGTPNYFRELWGRILET